MAVEKRAGDPAHLEELVDAVEVRVLRPVGRGQGGVVVALRAVQAVLLVRIAPVLDGVDDHVPVGLLDVELLQEPVQTVPAEPV